jgi:hypothetical protein
VTRFKIHINRKKIVYLPVIHIVMLCFIHLDYGWGEVFVNNHSSFIRTEEGGNLI